MNAIRQLYLNELIRRTGYHPAASRSYSPAYPHASYGDREPGPEPLNPHPQIERQTGPDLSVNPHPQVVEPQRPRARQTPPQNNFQVIQPTRTLPSGSVNSARVPGMEIATPIGQELNALDAFSEQYGHQYLGTGNGLPRQNPDPRVVEPLMPRARERQNPQPSIQETPPPEKPISYLPNLFSNFDEFGRLTDKGGLRLNPHPPLPDEPSAWFNGSPKPIAGQIPRSGKVPYNQLNWQGKLGTSLGLSDITWEFRNTADGRAIARINNNLKLPDWFREALGRRFKPVKQVLPHLPNIAARHDFELGLTSGGELDASSSYGILQRPSDKNNKRKSAKNKSTNRGASQFTGLKFKKDGVHGVYSRTKRNNDKAGTGNFIGFQLPIYDY